MYPPTTSTHTLLKVFEENSKTNNKETAAAQ